jgi:hypothetical protein
MSKIKSKMSRKEQLERLEAILQNPSFAQWYHNEFVSYFLLPVEFVLAEDIKNWRQLISELIWEENLAK